VQGDVEPGAILRPCGRGRPRSWEQRYR
jgi:hypothetical protein